MKNEIDYWANKLPKCPHCDADFDVWHGDRPLALSYEEGGKTTFNCVRCQKEFICVTMVTYTFSTAVSEDAADNEEWGPQPDASVTQG